MSIGDVRLWICAAVAAIAGCAILLQRYLDTQRREALARLALRLGFSFSPDDRGLLAASALSRCSLFNAGHSRNAKNVLRGVRGGTETVVFDYQYTTGSGKYSHTYRQTVVAFQSARQALVEFQSRPKRFLDSVGSLFGRPPLNGSSHAGFSMLYVVRGVDEPAIRQAFRPDVLAFFGGKKGWSVDSGGGWLIAYQSGKEVKPEAFTGLIESTRAIASLFRVS